MLIPYLSGKCCNLSIPHSKEHRSHIIADTTHLPVHRIDEIIYEISLNVL